MTENLTRDQIRIKEENRTDIIYILKEYSSFIPFEVMCETWYKLQKYIPIPECAKS